MSDQMGLELDPIAAAIRLARALRRAGASAVEIDEQLRAALAEHYTAWLAERTARVLAHGWCLP